MELGALICTPKQPKCPICPLRQTCVALRTLAKSPNFPTSVPAPHPLPAASSPSSSQRSNGRYLVRQRPAGVVNAHLWEFPNVESPTANRAPNLRALAPAPPSARQFAPSKKLCAIKHTITRYRITMDVYRAVLSPAARSSDGPTPLKGTWFTPAQLTKLAFPSAHRKLLQTLAALR